MLYLAEEFLRFWMGGKIGGKRFQNAPLANLFPRGGVMQIIDPVGLKHEKVGKGFHMDQIHAVPSLDFPEEIGIHRAIQLNMGPNVGQFPKSILPQSLDYDPVNVQLVGIANQSQEREGEGREGSRNVLGIMVANGLQKGFAPVAGKGIQNARGSNDFKTTKTVING